MSWRFVIISARYTYLLTSSQSISANIIYYNANSYLHSSIGMMVCHYMISDYSVLSVAASIPDEVGLNVVRTFVWRFVARSSILISEVSSSSLHDLYSPTNPIFLDPRSCNIGFARNGFLYTQIDLPVTAVKKHHLRKRLQYFWICPNVAPLKCPSV